MAKVSMDRLIQIEAQRRLDADRSMPHAGEYACDCWNDEPEVLAMIFLIQREIKEKVLCS